MALAVVAPQTRRCSAFTALLSFNGFNSSFGNSAEMLYLIPLVLPMALAVVDCEHCEVKSASMIQRKMQKHGEDLKAQSCIASTTATCDTSAKAFVASTSSLPVVPNLHCCVSMVESFRPTHGDHEERND